MKDLARVRRVVLSQHPAVLAAVALLFVALAAAAVPSARAAAQRLITGKDIQNGSISNADLRDGSVNSHKLQDGHVLPRDLSKGLRDQIARRAADGKDGTAGPAGESVTAHVIPAGDPRCASGAGGVAYSLAGETVSVCNGRDGQSAIETTVALDTDLGDGWESNATATLDPNGWVHLTGYATCTGPTGCDDQLLELPSSVQSGPDKEVFQLQTEDPFSGAYDQVNGAIVVQADTVTVPDAHTGMLNSYRVWLSGITYKASVAG